MRDTTARWVLAFNASCGTCNRISVAVAEACDGKLEILPLVHQDVRRWLDRAGAAQRGPAPTLIRVRGEQVDLWMGPRLGFHLMRRLGPASTRRVLRALGALSVPDPVDAVPDTRPGIGRKEFLRLGTGAGLAAGLLLMGKTPALGATRDITSEAHAWVRLNKEHLPRTYGDFVQYPLAYRRAIFAELSTAARSEFWYEHLTSYRASNGSRLTPDQGNVLDSAMRLARDQTTFAPMAPDQRAKREKALSGLKDAAIAAYGNDEARGLIATLGPTQADVGALNSCPACECNAQDNWCVFNCCANLDCNDVGHTSTCNCSDTGCGTFWAYGCNGMCGPGCPSPCG
jgi:hypothetical protein